MSQIAQSPEARAIFNRYAGELRHGPLLGTIAPVANHAGMDMAPGIGTAIDYMIRMRICPLFNTSANVVLRGRQMVAETAAAAMMHNARLKGMYYENLANDAFHLTLEAREFMTTMNPAKYKTADLVKYGWGLSAIDPYLRDGSWPKKQPIEAGVERELSEMDARFYPEMLFRPKRFVFLNPVFGLSERAGGLDADLIVDDEICEIKAVSKVGGKPDRTTLLQLAGYAALMAKSGVHMNRPPGRRDCEVQEIAPRSISIYYARHGVKTKWMLDDLFPNGGFAAFVDDFISLVCG